MKQTNDLREENLLVTRVCAEKFWSEYNELTTTLNNISEQLSNIRRRSISRQYLDQEQEKLTQLTNEFTNNETKYNEIFETHCLQLVTLLANNEQEINDIQFSLIELGRQWNRLKIDLSICQIELSESIAKSDELNTKIENVSTWIEDKSSFTPNNVEADDELEHIRTFKEALENKYIDIISLKQDYIDIEHQNEHVPEDKPNVVEEQLVEIDSKWTQLKDKVQEQ